MKLIDKISNDTEGKRQEGTDVVQVGNEKLENAAEVKNALEGTQKLDEDTEQIINEAMEGAQEVADQNAEQVASEMENVNQGLDAIKSEADEGSAIEQQNADTVSGSVGDYGSVQSQAAGALEQHAEQIDSLGQSAQELNDEFKQQRNQIESDLKSFF